VLRAAHKATYYTAYLETIVKIKQAVKNSNPEVELGGMHSKPVGKQMSEDNSLVIRNEKRLQIQNKHELFHDVSGWLLFVESVNSEVK
jgi:hypothetical protein